MTKSLPNSGDQKTAALMDVFGALPNDEARSAFLSSTRQEMYGALGLFYTHVKYTISLMFTLMTVVFTIYGLAIREKVGAQQMFQFKLAGGVILLLLFPLGVISILIIGRYYKLYVAAVIYAAELHKAVSLGLHPWFTHLDQDLGSLPPEATHEHLLNKRTYGWPHSWLLYTILISCVSVGGLIAGIIIIFSSAS